MSLKYAKAIEARKFFTTKTRESSGDAFTCTTDDAPEWVSDMCYAAHGKMFPDDWRYSFILDALDALIDNDGDNDSALESIEPDVYNKDLLDWLSSRNDRASYCDDVAKEFGLDPYLGIIERIRFGQLAEKQEVFNQVCEFLEEIEE